MFPPVTDYDLVVYLRPERVATFQTEAIVPMTNLDSGDTGEHYHLAVLLCLN